MNALLIKKTAVCDFRSSCLADMASDNSPPPTGSAPMPSEGQAAPGPGRVLELVSARKVDAAIFAMRLATIVCSLLYMVPTFTPTAAANAKLHYERALLAAASAGAFKLHQITSQPTFRISEAFGSLWMRDVTQFFIYALLFLYNSRRMARILSFDSQEAQESMELNLKNDEDEI